MQQLPTDVILIIFDLVGESATVANMKFVCRRWWRIMRSVPQARRHMWFANPMSLFTLDRYKSALATACERIITASNLHVNLRAPLSKLKVEIVKRSMTHIQLSQAGDQHLHQIIREGLRLFCPTTSDEHIYNYLNAVSVTAMYCDSMLIALCIIVDLYLTFG